ncbi:hypothetical protein FQN57_002478 [Myotisia sp. PD_48]|nr:hypothetical protein FQN57_002478 [Myotisia sp. PD_48]
MRSAYLLTAGAAAVSAAAVSGAPAAKPHLAMYFDQWHYATLPNRTITAGVTHVITAFAESNIFLSGSSYTPFMPLSTIRAMFDPGTKVCMAVGGWGLSQGFGPGSTTDAKRKQYAKNIGDAVKRLGYDCVDVDWEYPGGNGEDYKRIPNSQKVGEIDAFPLLLADIKAAIGDKEISIAIPGKEIDMIAFTKQKVPEINAVVDWVNIMAYDIMNRRDKFTNHHTSVEDSIKLIDLYIERGFTPSKIILGFAFYAKWFTTAPKANCLEPVGCPVAELEAPNGDDTLKSGAMTFELANRNDPDFAKALKNGKMDTKLGGAWYWDSTKGVFWSWDTAEFITQKFERIVKPKGLGGAMAWSLAQDAIDWSHFKAITAGIKSMS